MVSPMPRTVEEILAHADELATRFEYYEPNPADEVADEAVAALRGAVGERSTAERHVRDAVQEARAAGLSWAKIGHILGTSGQAVRPRSGNNRACGIPRRQPLVSRSRIRHFEGSRHPIEMSAR